MSSITIDPELKPGEFVIKSLFAEFAVLAEKKIEMVMAEPLVSLQGGKAGVKKHRKLNSIHGMWCGTHCLDNLFSFATNSHALSHH